MVRTGLALLLISGLTGLAPGVDAKGRGKALRHEIIPGETLSGIAALYGCSVSEIRSGNGITGDMIHPGQKLKIPSCIGTGGKEGRSRLVEHEVAAGETLSEIARRYGTSVTAIAKRNKLKGDFIRTGQTLRVLPTLPVRPRRRFVYTVQPGDNLIDIARRYGMRWREIQRLNPRIRNVNRIRIGSRLTLFLAGPSERSATVGKPQAGRLVRAEQLPSGPGYFRRRPHLAWGTNETITNLTAGIAAVQSGVSKAHDVAIGDISAKDGGPLRQHKSHQSGRDVDIGFWFTNQPMEGPKGFLSGFAHPLDYEANWLFLTALTGKSPYRSTANYIFLDYGLQKKIYDWALEKKGVSKSTLNWMFQYPRGRRTLRGIIRHAGGHDDHYHIRFKCPPDDEKCV